MPAARLDRATAYTLKATSGALTSTTTPTITITFGSATQLIFTTQPGGGKAAAAWITSNQPVVTIMDAGGNTVTTSSASITLAIGTNPGSGTLTCTTNPLSATSGVATFAGCKIDNAGTGYTLTAAASGLTGATSTTFTIVTVTAVTVSSLTAVPSGSGNLIRLQTGREVSNLGFNIYREQNAQRSRLNSSLLAGSALMGGTGPITRGSFAISFRFCSKQRPFPDECDECQLP